MTIYYRLKRRLLNNIHFKVLSMTIAITLWAYVNSNIQKTETLLLPVHYIEMPAGLKIDRKNTVGEVEVFFSGSNTTLLGLEGQGVIVELDLSGAGPGKNRINVERKDIKNMDDDIRIARIVPHSIVVNLAAENE